MITESHIEIAMPDGMADAYLYHASDGSAAPGLIHYTNTLGIRTDNRAMAHAQAEAGFTVLLPNIFYRVARPPILSYPIDRNDKETAALMKRLTGSLSPGAMTADCAAYVDFLAAHPATLPGPMGVVGYCFTGAMALRTAAARPDLIAAAVSFHGGHLHTDQPTSPHLLLSTIQAKLYFGYAENDPTMPDGMVEKFESVLEVWPGHAEREHYTGAEHGWTQPAGPAYNKEKADHAHNKLVTFMRSALLGRENGND